MKKRKLKTRKLLLIAFFVVVSVLVILKIALPQRADASWFDESWQYRKKINIASHTASENNVYVTTPTFDATDTTRFKSGCGNIRFTKENGEVLPYFVVACTASASMHVFFDTLPAGESNYYMYYGNVNAPNANSATDFSTAATGLGALALGSETAGPGPIAYWKFDEGTGTTTSDSTPNADTGTLTLMSSPPSATSGWQTEDQCVSGKCLGFDGSNDLVGAGNATVLNGLTSMTISMWINPKTLPSAVKDLFTKWNAASQQTFDFALMSQNGIVFTIASSLSDAGTNYGYTPALSSANAWYHVEAVFDGTQSGNSNRLKIYINGVQQTLTFNGTIPASMTTSTSAVEIGGDTETGRYFNGRIDDVKTYGYARSAAQVRADFASRGGKEGASTRVRNGTTYLSDGLVGYWKMDEASWNGTAGEVKDASGLGQNGTAGGSATTASGKFGNGGSFNGSTQYVKYTGNQTGLSGDTSYTISVWINPTSLASTSDPFGLIDGVGVTGAEAAILLNLNGTGSVGFHFATCGQNTAAGVITTNQWQHIVITKSPGPVASTTTFYVNGIQVASTNQFANCTPSLNINRINIGGGWNNSDTTFPFPGKVDEARIYNRVLSASEVRNLYNFAPGPVGYWNFEEGTGTSVNDGSGNINTGTWNGTGVHWNSGKFGNGGNFTGSTGNDYVTVTSSSAFRPANGVTVSTWVKVASTTTAYQIMRGVDLNSGADYGYTLAASTTNSGKYDFYVRYTSGSDSLIQATISDTNWHYLTGTWDGATQSIYLDGVFQTSTARTGTLTYSSGPLIMGMTNSVSHLNALNGQLDDLKVYNYARTPSQILEDMNGSHPVGGSPIGSQIINWKLDEQNGTTVNNSGFGGSTYAGTDSGAAWLTNASCKVNGCLNFDTTTDTMSAGDVAFVDGLTGFSTSFWLNPQTLATNKMIISKANNTTQRVFQIKTDDTTAAKLKVMISSSASDTSNYCVTANSVLTASTWQYITVIYDGTLSTGNDNRVKVYVNGNLASCTVTGTIPTSLVSGTTSNLKLGQGDDATPTALLTYIDEVKIYNTALTYDQMLVDFNAGAAQNYGTGTNEATQLSDGAGAAPIGYWNFQEGTGTVKDVSGNGNDGTWNGTGVKHWGAGYYGKAGNFNGSDDFVDMGNITAVNSLAAFSVGVWINSSSYTGGHAIFNKWTASTQDTFDLELSGSNIYVCVANAITDAGNNCVNTTTSLTTGVWYHIEAVYDGSLAAASRAKIYLNGVLQTVTVTGTIPTSLTSSTAPVRIGAFSGTLTRYFSGRIDEVKMYNYARTQAQVAYDYNRGRPVAWWKMDECQGSSINDASGNGNTGTITIGATGTQTAVGTCTTASTAWGNGATGKFNSSLNFDGTNDYVTMGNQSLLDHNSSLTLSAWIKTTQSLGGSNFGAIAGKGFLQGIINGYGLYLDGDNSNKVTFQIRQVTGNALVTVTSSRALNDGNWHFVVGTRNDSTNTSKIYVDGVLNSTNSSTTIADGSSTSPFAIGARDAGGAFFFNGQIDDVRVYNYDLSASQIQKLYNNDSSALFGPSQGAP